MDIASALSAFLDTDAADAERDRHGVGKFLRTCTDDERRAALDLLAAAALDDGTISASERAMLDRHGTSGAAAEVHAALARVEAAMPFRGDAERRRFLAERADVVRGTADRERLLGACVAVLENAAAPNVEARCLIFASALGLTDAALARARGR
jgi:hypothetical protein